MSTSDMWRFQNNKDRFTFLAAQFKWPIVFFLAGVGVLAAFTIREIPNPLPPWVFTFAFGWVIAAIPLYVLFLVLFQSRESDDRYTVGIADPGSEDIYTAYAVDPELWESAHVVGYPPAEPSEGFDYVVTKLEHYDDVGELEVRGVDPDLTPAGAYDASSRVDVVYENHHVVRRQYRELRSTMMDLAEKVQDLTIMGLLSQREDSSLAPGVEPEDLIREMEKDAEDLPDAPEPNPPAQHERANGLDRYDADVPDESESIRLDPPEREGDQ